MKNFFKACFDWPGLILSAAGTGISILTWYFAGSHMFKASTFIITVSALVVIIAFLMCGILKYVRPDDFESKISVTLFQAPNVLVFDNKPFFQTGYLVSVYFVENGVEKFFAIGRIENILRNKRLAQAKILNFGDDERFSFQSLDKKQISLSDLSVSPLCHAQHVKLLNKKSL